MGASEQGPLCALLGKTRRAILALLFSRSDEAFYYRQIERLTNGWPGSVQRELKNLANAGVITRQRRGRQVYYQANAESPIFPELRTLIIKTEGAADVLRFALAAVSDRIRFAFIYGSFAKGKESASSDIDLMIVGDIGTREAVSLLREARRKLGREINPSVYSQDDFRKRAIASNSFITRILNESKIMLIGNGHELEKLG